ncbi:unnamed protein product [Pleuronectes platessa]|uniref:Uncharacterized protein n=1 Tax=Pleuronectes platessa TaxID=8262 RepID=A0A9N7VJD8_PLEPL|nr:unnamed protein product [Pleuronectes platessa]
MVPTALQLHPGKQGPFGTTGLYGKIPSNWKRPLNFAQRQKFKSPSEGTGVLWRNEELLGQNSLWIPAQTAGGDAEPGC